MKILRNGAATAVTPDGHYGGLTVSNVSTKAETGSFSIQVSTCPPGGGGEMHSHPADTQVFFVIDGELSFDVADREFTLGAGDAVVFQRNERHATRNPSTSTVSRSLVITVTDDPGAAGLAR